MFFSPSRSEPKERRRGLATARPGIELLEDRSLPSVNLGTNFPGLDFDHTQVGAPPDTIAAVGRNHIVEMVNTNIAIYTKGGAAAVPLQSLSDFFASVRTGNFLSDPVVIFDESFDNGPGNDPGRFIVGVLDLSATFFGTISGDSFLYAVSDSADPTQDTNGDGKAFSEMHAINMTENVAAGTVFADYPRIGWNADGYYVTFNMFTTGFFNAYDHVSVISIDKAAATDRNNATGAFTHVNVPGGVSHATLAPATMHGSVASTAGSPQPMYFVEEKLDGSGNATGNAIRVVTATNLLGGSPSFAFTDIGVDSYRQPPAAAQRGSSSQITTNDGRILNAEWRDNRLVATHTIGVNTDSQAHARWYDITTSSTPALTQQGTIGLGSGSSSYFPSIAIAPSGDLGMTYIQSSSTEYMSMYVTGRTSGDPVGAMQTPVLVKAGERDYFATFDSSPYRAGDYSGITVDPIDGSFWAANEYAEVSTSTQANWATWIANFALSTPTPVHDVAVTAVSASPNPVVQGNTVTVSVTVANQGSFSETFGVSVAESPDGANLGTQTVTLAPGQVQTLTFSWATSTSTTAGGHTLTASIAPVSGETDTADNTRSTAVSVTAPVHDVAVTAASATPNPVVQGNTVTVSVTVANQGGFSETFGVSVAESPGGADLGTQTVTLAPGEVRTLTFTWATSATTTTGSHTLTASIAALSGETDTADNTRSTTVTVNAPVAGSVNDIYVWDMAWSATRKGNWITASVTLFVKQDSDGDGIAEASDAAASGVVTNFVLDHYWSGLLISSTTFANAKTNGRGQVTFNLKTQYDGQFHAEVTSMSQSGRTRNTGLDQDNPSCYQYSDATGNGSEIPCSQIFAAVENVRFLSATRTATGEVPPMLLHAAPVLPTSVFSSESSLFATEEFLRIDSNGSSGSGRGR